jgi:hypothetical protein
MTEPLEQLSKGTEMHMVIDNKSSGIIKILHRCETAPTEETEDTEYVVVDVYPKYYVMRRSHFFPPDKFNT